MFKKLLALTLFLIHISTTFASTDSPKDIVEKRCIACHNLSLVYNAKKSKAEWEKTVERMIRYGARLNEEEREAVINYLQHLE